MVQYRTLLRRVRRVHGQRQQPLVRAPPRRRAAGARSPTSAPSSGCTSRWASTRAAWACSPATTARPPRTWRCPFVAVGLFYRHGYFRQTIDADGHQEHAYPDLDPSRLPHPAGAGPAWATRSRSRSSCPGAPSTSPSGWSRWVACRCCCWTPTRRSTRTQDRPITHILYVRGREMRLHQELVLGVGGRARAAGAGHRARRRGTSTRATRRSCSWSRPASTGRAGLPLDEALARVRSGAVFTIHTPVSAGNERFEADLVRRVAGPLHRARRRGHRAHPGDRPGRRWRPEPVRHDRLLAAA